MGGQSPAASIACDGIWQTPEFTASTVPFTRCADLCVYATGVDVGITTPGAGNPNHGERLSWADVVAIVIKPGPKRSEVAIVFGTEDRPTAARFKAPNNRIQPVVEALRTHAPAELFRL